MQHRNDGHCQDSQASAWRQLEIECEYITFLCPVFYVENMDNNTNFPFKMLTYETESTERAQKITAYMLNVWFIHQYYSVSIIGTNATRKKKNAWIDWAGTEPLRN